MLILLIVTHGPKSCWHVLIKNIQNQWRPSSEGNLLDSFGPAMLWEKDENKPKGRDWPIELMCENLKVKLKTELLYFQLVFSLTKPLLMQVTTLETQYKQYPSQSDIIDLNYDRNIGHRSNQSPYKRVPCQNNSRLKLSKVWLNIVKQNA